MKRIFKNFMVLSLGLALVAAGCKKDEDVIADLNGEYTANVVARIGEESVYPNAQAGDPATLDFKVENAKESAFTITGQLTLNSFLPASFAGAVINVALNANNAQVTKNDVLGVSV
ncbi:MAG: hypothetical protein LBB31_03760, partial [Prevotellaceae bacterium]|nr:hypothetical protein [Prevotellaceae bacterium]